MKPPFLPGFFVVRPAKYQTTSYAMSFTLARIGQTFRSALYISNPSAYVDLVYRQVLYVPAVVQQMVIPSLGSPFWPGGMGRRRKSGLDTATPQAVIADGVLHMTIIL